MIKEIWAQIGDDWEDDDCLVHCWQPSDAGPEGSWTTVRLRGAPAKIQADILRLRGEGYTGYILVDI